MGGRRGTKRGELGARTPKNVTVSGGDRGRDQKSKTQPHFAN